MSSERHFGRAAAQLNMTQPAVSQRIHTLERELGIKLLIRSSRGVSLTRSGEQFLPYALRLVQIADQANRDMRSSADGRTDTLRLAYLPQVDVAVPASIIAAFRCRHPSVELVTNDGHTQSNIDHVAGGEIDFAFIAPKGDLPPALAYRRVALGEMVVALPAGHRLAATKLVWASDLSGERLILFPTHLNPSLVDGLLSWLNRHTSGTFTVYASEPFEQAVGLVARTGSGAAMVPSQLASRTVVEGVVFRSVSPAPVFEVGAIYRRDDPSPALRKMIQVVNEVAGSTVFVLPEGGELIE